MRAGDLLAGRYRLAERIGVGGMAEVWRGDDEVLARQVAIKLIDPALLADEAFRLRFRAEARAAAGLSHPHVVTVHDYGEQDGTPYIVMELLDGETLADRLAGGPLAPAGAATVCGQMAAALAAAHETGLVHRDVKPANVFLTRGGVKVLDFGVAVRGETGPAFGTPAYLAPEQLAHGPVTAAADVFALGVVLFEALTGRRPFGEDDERTEPPPFPPDTPAAIASLGARCLAADPAARPGSAEVAAAFAEQPGERAGEPVEPVEPAEPSAESVEAAEVQAAAGDRPETPTARSRTAVLDAPAGIGPWRRRLLIAGAVAVPAALAVALVIASRDADDPEAAAAPTAAPPSATAPATAPPTAATTPAGALEALAKMRRSLDEGAAAGQVRSDVAIDFGNLISQLEAELSTGEPVDDLNARIAQLRVKIEQRLREGGLTAERARDLRAALAGIS
ncbi:MAG TPA: serine/threonine-protein kinase [Streptosporangiaceae bacterium]|nr:serine/threonine-protein kinase [Streptosporangiaceae bacterium]